MLAKLRGKNRNHKDDNRLSKLRMSISGPTNHKDDNRVSKLRMSISAPTGFQHANHMCVVVRLYVVSLSGPPALRPIHPARSRLVPPRPDSSPYLPVSLFVATSPSLACRGTTPNTDVGKPLPAEIAQRDTNAATRTAEAGRTTAPPPPPAGSASVAGSGVAAAVPERPPMTTQQKQKLRESISGPMTLANKPVPAPRVGLSAGLAAIEQVTEADLPPPSIGDLAESQAAEAVVAIAAAKQAEVPTDALLVQGYLSIARATGTNAEGVEVRMSRLSSRAAPPCPAPPRMHGLPSWGCRPISHGFGWFLSQRSSPLAAAWPES